MKARTTKQSFVLSLLALLVCVSMFVGSTFAWFTDSVSSVNNIIKSGNLDITLEYSFDGDNWNPVLPETKIFPEEDLWEPGFTRAVALRVKNVGTLAAKYDLAANIVSETEGTNVYDKTFKLSDYLEVYAVGPQAAGAIGDILTDLVLNNRDKALGNGTSMEKKAFNTVLMSDNNLTKDEEHVLCLAITMPTTVDNKANHKTGTTAPKITLGITANATQVPYEEDSFGNDYDEDAFVADFFVDTPEALGDALADAKEGEVVAMMGDISKSETESNAYGQTAVSVNNGQTLDGKGNTLDAPTANGTWDSAINITSGTIKNLTINSGFRGIFINHNSSVTGPVILENVVIDGPTYTISCDQGSNNGLTATNCVFNGWTSYAGTLGDVTFTDCSFGEGSGYAFCRPYAPTTFVGCDFEAGYRLDARAAVTFENCTIDGAPLTSVNLSTLVTSNIANATVK